MRSAGVGDEIETLMREVRMKGGRYTREVTQDCSLHPFNNIVLVKYELRLFMAFSSFPISVHRSSSEYIASS